MIKIIVLYFVIHGLTPILADFSSPIVIKEVKNNTTKTTGRMFYQDNQLSLEIRDIGYNATQKMYYKGTLIFSDLNCGELRTIDSIPNDLTIIITKINKNNKELSNKFQELILLGYLKGGDNIVSAFGVDNQGFINPLTKSEYEKIKKTK